jgi:site-specific recombinase XerD
MPVSVQVPVGRDRFAVMAKQAKKSRGVYEKVPGSGVWWVRYSDGKRIRREKVGRKSDAIDRYHKRKGEVLGGETIPRRKGHGIKISDLCADVLQWYKERGRKSLRSFEQKLNVIERELGHFAADGLTPDAIDAWLTKHSEWSPATKNRHKSVLSKAYQLALQRGKLEKNPARLVEHRPETTRKIRYLKPDEEVRLRRAIMKLSPKQLPAFEIALHTGMRQGEQFGLKWQSIDFERRTIYLAETKNGHHREIPMNETCFKALKKLHDEEQTKDGGLFPSSRYKASIRDPKKWWLAALEEAKVREFRWHDLRHTFISRLVMRGADLRTVQELSGHRELSMLTRYAHLSPAHNRKAIELLDADPTG